MLPCMVSLLMCSTPVHVDPTLALQCVELAHHALRSVAGPALLAYLHAVTRSMLGTEWADAYGLPPTHMYWRAVLLLQRVCVRLAIALEWVPWVAAWRRRAAAVFVGRIMERMQEGVPSFATPQGVQR